MLKPRFRPAARRVAGIARNLVRTDHTPERDGTEVCVAVRCVAVRPDWLDTGRSLPYGPDQMRRCEVPPADPKRSALKAGQDVENATPHLVPLWCPEGCGWFHAVCYSTHHHKGWTPAPDTDRIDTRTAHA